MLTRKDTPTVQPSAIRAAGTSKANAIHGHEVPSVHVIGHFHKTRAAAQANAEVLGGLTDKSFWSGRGSQGKLPETHKPTRKKTTTAQPMTPGVTLPKNAGRSPGQCPSTRRGLLIGHASYPICIPKIQLVFGTTFLALNAPLRFAFQGIIPHGGGHAVNAASNPVNHAVSGISHALRSVVTFLLHSSANPLSLPSMPRSAAPLPSSGWGTPAELEHFIDNAAMEEGEITSIYIDSEYEG
ncbi:hypothetical protein K470DRAFT_267846 [Piedraia hortae CBS 480.64]|uniref:Uncharacterized protein n=1 Tax=Piedraia hortae CBS 480.64 TaxID=1314780 RepID=A0A6A7C9A3_9PEZI|nr:hypothetical protein K470DRAFT_267846 [Piedraia hortae CBS 480.64]